MRNPHRRQTPPLSDSTGVSSPIPREFRSDFPIRPGAFLRAELEARGMTQADLAARTGLSTKHVNHVLQGTASMSSDVAVTLERVLGTPASTWTSMDARWQEARSRRRAHEHFAEDVDWAKRFPLREMIARNILTGHEAGSTLVEALLRLFRVADPSAFEQVWRSPLEGGFRRAQQFEVDDYATATWLLLAERQTDALELAPYSVSLLRAAVPKLRVLTCLSVTEGFIEARAVLASCGVALAFVRHIDGSRICGATWWSGPNRPMIALSERHKKEDIFWFSLFHEIAHLLLHPRRSAFVKFEIDTGDDADGRESEADDFAAKTLIPAEYNPAIGRSNTVQLRRLAEELGVGAALVAGRRGHLTGQWPQVNRLRRALDVRGLTNAAQKPGFRP